MTEPRTPAGSGPVEKEIRRAAELIADGVVEVRALADGATHSGYFDDYERLAQAVEALDADPSITGIYVTLNAVNPALLARRANRIKMRLSRKDATTADTDIIRRRWLPIDIDPVRPSGVSSTEAEHTAAIDATSRIAKYLTEQGFGEPLIADSGNGAHLLYRVDLPNDDAATELVKGVLTTLDVLFSNDVITVDTANHNAGRIWKLYGTVSRKGDFTPERPHRRAKILSAPEEMKVVPADRLQAIAGLLPREEPPRRKKGSRKIDLASWLLDHGIAVRNTKPWNGGTLYVLEECPFSGAHKDGAFAIQFANGAIHAGCHHASCGGGAQRWPELRAMHETRGKKEAKNRTSGSGAPATRNTEIAGAKAGAPTGNPTPPPDKYRERALEILQTGDPLTFILDTFSKTHVGDRIVAECLALSIASQTIENIHGLHVAVSGNSSKGKSHACRVMLNLIPEDYRLTGTVSDKALYYDDNIRAGTVFLFDDTSLSDDLQEVVKSATSSFHEPIEHRTITADRQLRIRVIPERCVWWLAKVENPGDDQVMGRMLTVWIDDTTEQDWEVLEHMKWMEAGMLTWKGDPDILVCRAIWSIIKEQRIAIRIPYAMSIQFSSAANRRNPVMFFDLIKCHALFRFMQVPSTEVDGMIQIDATRADFDAAAKLYRAINQEIGSQEAKLTRNEAAALRTIERMGWEQFTIKMLQDAMGLSYSQTRRILQGYSAKGAVYAGLLEKCPAVSMVDATVIDDTSGVVIRRHEHLFQFDVRGYREWMGGLAVWLDDDGDDGNDSPPSGGGPGSGCDGGGDARPLDTIAAETSDSDNDSDARPLDTIAAETSDSDNDSDARPLEVIAAETSGSDGGCDSDSDTRSLDVIAAETSGSDGDSDRSCNQGCKHGCKQGCKEIPADENPESKPESENNEIFGRIKNPDPESCTTFPGMVKTLSLPAGGLALRGGIAGLAGTSRGGGSAVLPLPGVLDPGEFERVRVDLGRCSICNAGKAVYRSRSARASICERCYSRLVREQNGREGVR